MDNYTIGAGVRRQSGAVLYTGLIFLIVLTMFVLAMVRGGTFEQRVSANARDQQRALEAAEAVVRHAEESIIERSLFDPFKMQAFTNTCTGGNCFQPNAASAWNVMTWTTANSRTFAGVDGAELATVTTQPRYIVELVTPPRRTSSATQCEDGVARIIGRGQGNNGAVVFVQSTIRFRVYTNICY